MRKDLRWKFTIIAAVAGLSLFLIYPVGEKVKLGLDLSGGMHLVLQVRTDDAVQAALDLRAGAMEEQFNRRNLRYARVDRFVESASLLVMEADSVSSAEFQQVYEDQLPSWDLSAEGDSWRLSMPVAEQDFIRETAVTDTLERIRNRIDQYGVVEPTIQRQGLTSDRIVIQLPGVDNPERVKGLLSKPAFLEFKLVTYPPEWQGGSISGAQDPNTVLALFGGALPPDSDIFPEEQKGIDGTVIGTAYWPLRKASPLSGSDLVMARRGQDQMGRPAVEFTFTGDAGARFERLTSSNVGRQLAITLDGKLITAPNINSAINVNGIIEGDFTIEEAEDLAFMLRSGALPAGTLVLEERTVGPSLGRDSIRKGITASMAGLLISMIFMLWYYKGAGINAVIALLLNVLILLGVMAYFGATLSLPGIAGVILTFGMAFDANVLIFERIREELRAGKTVRAAIDAGFKKAFTAIFDSNLTTVIAAVFLIQFGAGPVRGFAVTLCIGIIASMFTAVFVSRVIFQWRLGEGRRVERLSI